MIPLAVGTVLAVSALCFVVWPLIRPDRAMRAAPQPSRIPADDAIAALREVEFDKATGKISEGDYVALKAQYTRKAVAKMRAGERPVCERCGPRPEPGAVFCSSCGAALAA